MAKTKGEIAALFRGSARLEIHDLELMLLRKAGCD